MYTAENQGWLPWSSFDSQASGAPAVAADIAAGAVYVNSYVPGKIMWRWQISRYLGIKLGNYDIPYLSQDPRRPLTNGVFKCPLADFVISAPTCAMRRGATGGTRHTWAAPSRRRPLVGLVRSQRTRRLFA